MWIREEQMQAFGAAAVQNFEASVAAKLKERFPKQCAAMGEDALKELVHLGRELAEEHGFKTCNGISAYIHLMVPLGAWFDRDPQYPWAGELLDRGGFCNEQARFRALRERGVEFLNQIAGPGGAFVKAMMIRLRSEKLDGFEASGLPQVETYMLQRLHSIFPERAEAAGDDALLGVVARAVEIAEKYELTSEAGVTLLLVLMFLLGIGLDADPQHAWAARVLQEPGDPDRKAENLHEAALAYLSRIEG